jgi:hypothetical protein
MQQVCATVKGFVVNISELLHKRAFVQAVLLVGNN